MPPDVTELLQAWAQGDQDARAQMIEANPELDPQDLKSILIQTARRLPHVETDRQGWGVVDPRRAVDEAVRRRAPLEPSARTPRPPSP